MKPSGKNSYTQLPHYDYFREEAVTCQAFAMEGFREKCLESGMNNYIAKPVRIEDLVDVLSKYQALL